MKRYDSYKPSGIECIEDIPLDWQVTRCKEIFEYDKGITPESNNSKFYDPEEYEWLTISDMPSNSKFVTSTSNKISQYAVDSLFMTMSPKGSLLYSFKLSIGKVAFLDRDMFTNEAILSIFPSRSQNLDFWYYALPYFLQFYSKKNIYGASMLNEKLIANAIIPLPPIAEQTAIANYLDNKTENIDKRICLLKDKISHYRDLRRSLINHVVTKGLNNNVPLKPSGIDWLGDIPQHWEVKRIKDIFFYVDEVVIEISNNCFVTLDNLESFTGHLSDLRSNDENKNLTAFMIGDVILNKLRPYLGKVYYANFDGGAEGELLVMRAKPNIHSKYYFYRLLSYAFIFKMNSMSTGVKMPRTSPDKILAMDVPLPPITEQTAIANYLDEKTSKIDSIIAAAERQISQLTELRRALINDVVTGKIKVV